MTTTATMTLALVIEYSEESLDSNGETTTYRVEGDKLTKNTERIGRARGEKLPNDEGSKKLTGSQIAALQKLLRDGKLLDSYEKSYSRPSPSPSFHSHEIARLDASLGGERGTISVGSGTGSKPSEGTIQDDSMYSKLHELAAFLETMLFE